MIFGKFFLMVKFKNDEIRLKRLSLMSLQRRRERYIGIYMWKLLHGSTSIDLRFTFVDNKRHGLIAQVPTLKKVVR